MPIPANQMINYEIRMQGLIGAQGSTTKNTFTTFVYRRTTTVVPVNKTHLNTIFQSSVGANVVALLNARWSQSVNLIRCLDDATDLETSFAEVNAGAIAGDSMASHITAFVLKRTALRGKHYRGNNKFGPLSESDSTAGTADLLNAAALARFATLASSMLATFTDTDGNIWQPVVFSRKLSQVKVNPTTIVTADLVSTAVNKRFGRSKKREVASVY